MPISNHEDWIQIAELDDQDRICFTGEFRALMSELGWEAKAFVGHLLGLWYDPFEHLLDYTNEGRGWIRLMPQEKDSRPLFLPRVNQAWLSCTPRHWRRRCRRS